MPVHNTDGIRVAFLRIGTNYAWLFNFMCRQIYLGKVIISNLRSETWFIDGGILLGKRHILIISAIRSPGDWPVGCTTPQSRRFKISRKISQTMIVAIIT